MFFPSKSEVHKLKSMTIQFKKEKVCKKNIQHMYGRKCNLTAGADNNHKISQEQFLKGTQIIQPILLPVGLGIVFFFYNDAKSILLKRYRFLNGA